MKPVVLTIAFVVVYLSASPVPVAWAQSSSLYLRQEPAAPSQPLNQGTGALSPAIADNSFIAVQIPEPRQYAKNDLVTIIIRESFKTDLKSSLDTEKKIKINGEIKGFPDLQLDQLAQLRVKPSQFSDGKPTVGVDFDNDFEGDGQYARSETMTGRLTARIADVKPNGTLILEARETIIHDEEELAIILTGTCRAADITVDNTILSTELYDLHMDKQHKGELKKSTRKGLLSRVLEALFNF